MSGRELEDDDDELLDESVKQGDYTCWRVKCTPKEDHPSKQYGYRIVYIDHGKQSGVLGEQLEETFGEEQAENREGNPAEEGQRQAIVGAFFHFVLFLGSELA